MKIEIDSKMKKFTDEFADAFMNALKDGDIKGIRASGKDIKEVVAVAVQTYIETLADLRNEADTASNKEGITEVEKAICEARVKAYEECDRHFFASVMAGILTLALSGDVVTK